MRKSGAQAAVALALIALIVSSQTGCQIFERFRNNSSNAPIAFNGVPTQADFLARLADQSSRIRQLKADVQVSIEGMPRLQGTLAVERPDRLRLKAGLGGISELGVDVGSNSDAFWIWTRVGMPGETPAIYFARHEEYRLSQMRQAMPLEPKWIIDALGLTQFQPTDRHEGPFLRSDGLYELHTYHQTSQGPIVRVSVVDGRYGWINRQSIYDSSNRLIAYVDSIQYKYYPEFEVSLPQRIALHMIDPAAGDNEIVLDVNRYTVNSLYGDPEKLWSMPNPPDVPKIDLARQVASAALPGSPPSRPKYPSDVLAESEIASPHQRRLSSWYDDPGSNYSRQGIFR